MPQTTRFRFSASVNRHLTLLIMFQRGSREPAIAGRE